MRAESYDTFIDRVALNPIARELVIRAPTGNPL